MSSECILVLEDDPGNARLQKLCLERAGYQVLTAHSTGSAFKTLRETSVDLITVDYKLEGEITGLGFCAQLRASGFDTPVILVSGVSEQPVLVQALRIGIKDFIPKDEFLLEHLPATVASVLGRVRLERQLASGMPLARLGPRSGRVLILDDDDDAARRAARELERAGYQVTVAKTPESALDSIGREPVTLLIFENRLHGSHSGLAFYESIRSIGYEIPAILVTARSDSATTAHALRLGVREYVEKKPGYVPELAEVVQRVFERIQLEKQAGLSNAQLTAILSSAMDAIMTLDADGEVKLFNKAAELTFGCDASTAINTPASNFLPELFPAQAGSSALEERSSIETKGRRADGTIFPVEVTVAEATISGQQLYTIVGRDISARKEAEMALRRANEKLRVLNADLEQFAYSASHDLQEPLRNVVIYAQMLERSYQQRLDERANVFLQGIVSGAKRMETLITDLLTYTEAAKDVPLPSLTEVDAGAVLGRVRVSLETRIAEAEALVTSWQLPTVRVREAHLAQLFQNLVSNAIKYRGQDPPRIQVSAVREDDQWRFAVRDNGIGIESRYQQQIFELFKRLHSRERYAGSGIGLALCKRIVESYGGRIWVESEPGNGSTFFFTLPG